MSKQQSHCQYNTCDWGCYQLTMGLNFQQTIFQIVATIHQIFHWAANLLKLADEIRTTV